ncbi:MAG: PRC-barrel domain-containing protein [bacterium]
MLTNLHSLLHLPVITQSGTKLGKVHDLKIDVETHAINSYAVRASILGRSYLIKPVQVLEITREKIVVEDAVIRDIEREQIKQKDKSNALAGVAMSEEN